jgi:glutamine amidotransferase-like uncharacterized protein
MRSLLLLISILFSFTLSLQMPAAHAEYDLEGSSYQATHPSLIQPLSQNLASDLYHALHRSLTKDTKVIAIYNDRGAWDAGVDSFKLLVEYSGYQYKELNAKDIINGELTNDRYSSIIMPGGKSWNYLDDLGSVGAEAIRHFVANGGGYYGTCAGAYYASLKRSGGSHGTGVYGIGLLNGTAVDGGSLGWKAFKQGIRSYTTEPNFKSFQKNYKILLLGGPSFKYTTQEAQKNNIKAVLRNSLMPSAITMITLNYGKGRVFLSGPHGEIEENTLNDGYADPDSEWPLLKPFIEYVNGEEYPN